MTALAAVALLTACAKTTAVTPAASSSAAPSSAAAATPASSPGYPQQAADQALCAAYNSGSASDDFQAIAQAVQQAGSSVTPALANDMLNVVNNPGSVSQDEHNMVYVAMDCALVHVGKQPVELNK